MYYGKAMKHTPSWTQRPRFDILSWCSSLKQQKLDDNFIIESIIDDFIRRAALQIMRANWDSFCQVIAVRLILDFKFCIDTGEAKDMFCRQSTYIVYESKIIVDYISQLEANGWIRDYEGSCGDLLLLATQPHQESCVDIDKFVWILCVSYRSFNHVIQSFDFFIPRCSNNIEDLGDPHEHILFISIDAHSVYRQIRVRAYDQEKLSFFTPDGKKRMLYCYDFWTKDCIRLLLAIMKILRDYWVFKKSHHLSYFCYQYCL